MIHAGRNNLDLVGQFIEWNGQTDYCQTAELPSMLTYLQAMSAACDTHPSYFALCVTNGTGCSVGGTKLNVTHAHINKMSA